MKFSIIIPVYNSAPFLEKCLDSLLNQEYKDYEIIVIDDGSTDGSYSIGLSYQQKYHNIHVLHQNNSGPSAARNKGLSMAQGEYILFVDSDDSVSEDYFLNLDLAVKTRPDVIFFGSYHLNENVNPKKIFPAKEVFGKQDIVTFFTDNLNSGDTHSCTNKAFLNEIITKNKIVFPINTVVEEDLLFVLRFIDSSSHLISLSEILYKYNRRQSGSVTTKYNPIKFESKLKAYNEEMLYAKRWQSNKLEVYFRDSFLSCISSSINNLMYKSCMLTKKEKIHNIKYYYQHEVTKDCINAGKPISFRSKVMWYLIRLKMYKTSFYLHKIFIYLKGVY